MVAENWLVRTIVWRKGKRTVWSLVAEARGEGVGECETESDEDDSGSSDERNAHLFTSHCFGEAGHQLGRVFVGEGELECDGSCCQQCSNGCRCCLVEALESFTCKRLEIPQVGNGHQRP